LEQGIAALTYAVRPRAVGHYLGQLFVVLAALTVAPLLVSLWYGEYAFTWRLGAVIAVLLLTGWPLMRLPTPPHIQANEALVLVALTFIIASALMTYPMMAAGLGGLDAWFESVSGVTTTGLSTLAHLNGRPHTFLFLRAWMQWYGGLGIVVLSLALLMGHHMAARRLAEPVVGEALATTARTHARRMLAVYVALTVFGVALLWALGMGGFEAVSHVLAAVSTGGFSTFNASLAGLDRWSMRFGVMAIAFCGAVPLVLYYRAVHGEWRAVLRDVELRALAAATLLVGVLLTVFMAQTPAAGGGAPLGFGRALADGMLLGISAQTTTGFTSVPIVALAAPAKLVLIAAMAVGGGVGSTAGGIKMLRLIVVLRIVQFTVRRSAIPTHAVVTPRVGGRALEQEDVVRALLLVVLFALVALLSWLAFLVYGFDPLDALFEVTSATATVGLSTGITSHALAAPLKVILCLDMLLGRLEIVALLVLFYPPTWFGKRGETP